jgi:hypothetical protein
MIKIRFRNFPGDKSYGHFAELVELATGEKTIIISDPKINVDLEITGPYNSQSDNFKTPFSIRLRRFGYIVFTNGKHLARRDLAVGIQPLKSAKKNIWYTGENERPPQGDWDGYLSFDTNLPKDRCVYFPLWFLTSTDLFKSTTESYWGGKVPTISELMNGRVYKPGKKKFAASFIGKNYSMRLHALEALSQISSIDIFGESVRNQIKIPAKVAKKYKFIMCFENDIYPGYVTEKPLEAYIGNAIPLYYGLDTANYLNSKAIINLTDYKNLSNWATHVNEIEKSSTLYKKIYEEPILLKKPRLDPALNLIRKVLGA